tara:strand:- start:21403 stop:22191 length:789 start_codon:yes stop_codon:yes gene_type:complete
MSEKSLCYSDSTFAVTETPVLIEGTVNSDDYKMIIRNDTCEVLSCMSKDYKLVTNEEVLDKSLPHIKEKGGELTEQRVFGNGARTSWTFQFKRHPVTIGGEKLYPQLNIKNSYDGSSTVSVLGGVFRLLCSNGAIIGQIFDQHSERHSVYNTTLNNGHIGKMVENTIDSMGKVFSTEFPVLFETQIKDHKDVVRAIEKLPSKYNEDAVNYLLTHKPKTYWDLFNLLTWVLTHRANRDHETTHRLESEVYHFIRKMVPGIARA